MGESSFFSLMYFPPMSRNTFPYRQLSCFQRGKFFIETLRRIEHIQKDITQEWNVKHSSP